MIILDSNIWIALLHRSDSQHKKAKDLFHSLKGPVLIPDFILSEVCTVLTQLAGKFLANQFLDLAMENNEALIFQLELKEFHETIFFYQKYSRNDLSFIDVMLLYLSKQYSVETFDIHLRKAIARK